jgi:exonuclease V gamma subunit
MRNPLRSSQRQTELNEKRTAESIDEYLTIKALLATWDDDRYTPGEVQARNHAYVLKLRARERNVRNYLAHRAGPGSDL